MERKFATHVQLTVGVSVYSDEPLTNEEAIEAALSLMPDPDELADGSVHGIEYQSAALVTESRILATGHLVNPNNN